MTSGSLLEVDISEGYYSESFWDVPNDKNIYIHGEGRNKTLITTKLSYNNYFIDFEGIIIAYF
jgi:hypothetical protein